MSERMIRVFEAKVNGRAPLEHLRVPLPADCVRVLRVDGPKYDGDIARFLVVYISAVAAEAPHAQP